MKRTTRIGGVILLSTTMLLLGLARTDAALATWRARDGYKTGTYYDAFSTDAYWSGITIPPGTEDLIYFVGAGGDSLSGEHVTIVFEKNVETQGMRIRYGSFQVTMDLDGYTYKTNSTLADNGYWEGGGAGSTIDFINSSATPSLVDLAFFAVGRNADTIGIANLTGPNIKMTTSVLSYIGTSGTGTMNVTGGAEFESATSMTLGHNAAGNGTLNVSGAGSEFKVGTAGSAHFNVGTAGTGAFTIENSGYLYVRSTLRFGVTTGTGEGLITGDNSLADAGVLALRGGSLSIRAGGRLETRGTVSDSIGAGGVLTVDDATASLQTDLELAADSTLAFVLKEERATPFITVGSNLSIADGTALLDLSLDPDESLGLDDYIPLLTYGGTLAGEFYGYEDGHTFQLGDHVFEITYAGGVGNDTVGLTVIPEPGAIGLLMAAAGMLALARRRTRKTR